MTLAPPSPPTAAAGDTYDVLVLDASRKQSLAAVRSFGRAGLRVAAGECRSEGSSRRAILGFNSRHTGATVWLPDFADVPDEFGAAVADFAGQHRVRVVLPTMDGSIAALTPWRARLAELGCTLALPADEALLTANDKDRTLRVARSLGIAYPQSMAIDSEQDLPGVLAAFSYPIVLKPTISWSSESGVRFAPVEVITEAEAKTSVGYFLGMGARILAQEWASGSREGVTLCVAGGEVVACCAHIVYRTRPALGGVSVMRQSLPVSPDIYAPAETLVKAIGLDGVCEVEFRRDAQGRPLLMEINARLAGTIENGIRSGFDFPLMIWQWATGQQVDRPGRTRTGVRTRWLGGDLEWLRTNAQRAGRPDSVSRLHAQWIFWSEFLRTRYYDCIDVRDPGPIIVQLGNVMPDAWRPYAARLRRLISVLARPRPAVAEFAGNERGRLPATAAGGASNREG